MKTRITELLGIEYPIIQGGMAWVAESHLAAAVSAAGGLGLIGGANAQAEDIRNYIREVKAVTDKPFGVNVMLMSPYADEVEKVVVEEGVKVVTTGAGNPEKYMELWKNAGINDITILEHINTNIVARPIPIPFSAEVVVPNVGHIPNKRTKVGFSLVIPLSIIFNLFIFSPPYFDWL